MSILIQIYDGWKNYMFPSPEYEELAKVRADICATSGPNGDKCEHANPEHKFKLFIPDAVTKAERNKEITGLGCTLCNCVLSAKVRAVKEECPLGKW